MTAAEQGIRAEPWLVARMRLVQLVCAAVTVALVIPRPHAPSHWPSSEEMVHELPFFLLLNLVLAGAFGSPLLVFLPVGARARAAFRRAPNWASIGRVTGCYGAALLGIPSLLLIKHPIAHDPSSTAALALLVVPIYWTVLGLVSCLVFWGLGRVVDRALRK